MSAALGAPVGAARKTLPAYLSDSKICTRCGLTKLIDDFHPHTRSDRGCRKYRQSQCKTCRAVGKRAARYGVTPESLEKALEAQRGVCAVCGTADFGSASWQVDHDHTSGEVRGILCLACNTSLGLLEEDPERIRSLAKYIEGSDA